MNIGVSVSKSKTQFFINQAYVDYIINAGFNPILITPNSDIKQMLSLCDGLLLPGGVDIEPTFYGENNISSSDVDPEKDDFERQILFTGIDLNLKIFGICRGFQLIVRTILQSHHIPTMLYYQNINNHSLVNARNIPRDIPSHNITINSEIMYGKGEKEQLIFVNSIHHQALLGTGRQIIHTFDKDNYVQVTGTTDFGLKNKKEFIIEAIDALISGTKVRGVQWHPEELNDVRLIQHFFSEQKKDEGFKKYGMANQN